MGMTEEELRTSWGERIRARRLELDLTQIQLAARLEIEQSTLSSIELGKTGASDRVRLRMREILGGDIFAWPEPA